MGLELGLEEGLEEGLGGRARARGWLGTFVVVSEATRLRSAMATCSLSAATWGEE